jgi:hypothetical protein
VPCPAEAARVWAWHVRRLCGAGEEEGGGLVSFERLPLPGRTTKIIFFSFFFSGHLF